MLPFTPTLELRRPFRDIVAKSVHLPNESQRLDYIEIKLQAFWHTYERCLDKARSNCWNAGARLSQMLHIAGVRNAREIYSLLLGLDSLECDENVLRCLAFGQYETGHGAMELANQLDELREVILRRRTAFVTLIEMRQDRRAAENFLKQRWDSRDRESRQLTAHWLQDNRPRFGRQWQEVSYTDRVVAPL